MARITKVKNQKAHAKRRAKERHGIDLHQDAMVKLVKQIQAGKATLIDRQSLRVTRWWVTHEGQPLPVVYDNRRKAIVTVLKPEMIK